MSMRVILLSAALLVGLFVGVVAFFTSTASYAADDDVEIVAVEVSPQIDAVADDDSRVEVQTWTIFAAIAGAAVGLLGFMVRVIMGWVKAPPPREESPH